MIKVAALTDGKNVPSARFRIRQHISHLREEGIAIREYCPHIDRYALIPGLPYTERIWGLWLAAKVAVQIPGILKSLTAQMIWLQRQILPGHYTLERLLKHPYILDADDAIWLALPHGHASVARTAQRAELVIVGNEFLADWFSSYAREVHIVPTAIDTNRFKPCGPASQQNAKRFVVGWTGLSSNFSHLYEIESSLTHFFRDHAEAELLVIADRPPKFLSLPQEKVRYIKWTPTAEVDAVQQMDVGIMPLADTDISRGKCSFKMLQYMSCERPVVVSPVGMNAKVLGMGNIGFPAIKGHEWYEALSVLYRDRKLALELGKNGRRIVEQHFSRRVVSKMLSTILRKIA